MTFNTGLNLISLIEMHLCGSVYHFVILITVTISNATIFSEPMVETKLGDIIGTYQNVEVFGKKGRVEAYLGIPYAEPPIGDLRFRKPVPKLPFASPHKAVKHGNACRQSIMVNIVKDVTVGEDCLFLNIYAPPGQREGLAVMVWIHGGGFVAGASDTYPSHALAVHGNVIVVTFNYRLSLWGFLSTGDEHAAGNYGLLDQHLAIKWVHENIKNFGGDPGRVTIFGESAGAASVVYQSMYEGNRGLFHRGIGQSGSVTPFWASQEDPKKDAEILGKAVGCKNMESVALVECLRKVPEDTLSASLNEPKNGLVKLPIPFVPNIDGEFIRESPKRMFDADLDNSSHESLFFSTLDFLTGINSDEGALIFPYLGITNAETFKPNRTDFEKLIPRALSFDFGADVPEVIKNLVVHEYTDWTDPENIEMIRHNLVDIYSELMFSIPMLKTVRRHVSVSEKSKTTYMYQFAIKPSANFLPTPSWISRANHADDLEYIFFDETAGVMTLLPGKDGYSPQKWESEVAEYMVTMWINFAKTR